MPQIDPQQGYQCCILAAGYHKEHDTPCSLWSLSNGNSILEWQVNTFHQALPNSEVRTCVGYHYHEVVAKFPHLHFTHCLNWQEGSALHSLLEIPYNSKHPLLVIYGDTVFYPETIAAVAATEGDAVIAIDSQWQQRFRNRTQLDMASAETLESTPYGQVEYTGLIKLTPKVFEWITKNQTEFPSNMGFLALIDGLRKAGFSVAEHDVQGKWAEMNEPNDLVHFVMGTKAETLRRLRTQLKKSTVCAQYTPTWQEWQHDPQQILARIAEQFPGQNLVVRSSSQDEDSWQTANAGVFESLLDVQGDNPQAITEAIDAVFASYHQAAEHAQVLVQPYVRGTVLSGVLLTSELRTGAPYYVFNYDDQSGKTDTVTAGSLGTLRTVFVVRGAAADRIDPRLGAVLQAAQEIEDVLGYHKLDIEFAIDGAGQVFTFQVRPVVVHAETVQHDEQALTAYLAQAATHFRAWQLPAPQVVGEYTLFSSMADWNPAEIIGKWPNPLAISLYRHLITDQIWAQQRAEYGYRDVRPSPLVHSFCGQPYVDCRASMNSFIPHDLPDATAARLVQAYLGMLRANPHLHDKIELDIVFTIWTPNFAQEAQARLRGTAVTEADIADLGHSLKSLTVRAITRLADDIAPVQTLQRRYPQIRAAELSPIEKAYLLLEDCRQYGTCAFAHAARAGFVAVTLLRSLCKSGVLTEARMLDFQGSVPTVAGEFQRALAHPDTPEAELVAHYGHLRPGTYDVNQAAYWENPEFYFHKPSVDVDSEPTSFQFTAPERAGLQAILDGLSARPDITVDQLVGFLAQAIQAREEVKFIFSRNISAALDLIIEFGRGTLELPREDIGYLSMEDISGLRTGQLDPSSIRALAHVRKAHTKSMHMAKLPSLICSPEDFFAFEQEKSAPNFITQQVAVAELVFIDSEAAVDGKIVAIPSADPGYDWLFSHPIKGLITQYGGTNSHMAIRCAELGIPAAIGIGDQAYAQLKPARMYLDCRIGHMKYV